MLLPAFIRRAFSFTAFQQAQGDDSFPGTELDVELDSTNNAVQALKDALATVLRADGRLQNGLVTRNSLAADILLGVSPARPWSALVVYAEGATVTRGSKLYRALVASTGLDPLTDATNATWEVAADLSQAVVIADGGVGTAALVNGAVTGPKIAPGAVGTAMIADASLTRAKAAPGFGLMPVGARISYGGLSAPAGWLLEYGQAVSRLVYADLFAALTLTFKADTTIGAATLANVTRSISGLGLQAAIVEGPGIPGGARLAVDADGAVAMNVQATVTAAQVTIRILPYGQGDGISTFNVPDSRGRADFGRDNMGGVGAGRLVTVLDGSALTNSAFNAGAGSEQTTLKLTNLPTNLPAGQVTVNYPDYNYTTRAAVANIISAASGALVNNVLVGDANAVTRTDETRRFAVDMANTNSNGSQPFGIIPPASVTNKIIFAGV